MSIMGVGVKVESDSYPMCGAKNRQGKECRQPAMKNGRCYYHGGPSLSGKEHGRYLHGLYTKEAKERRKLFAELMRQSRQFVEEITAD
jgi:hypothetical protein